MGDDEEGVRFTLKLKALDLSQSDLHLVSYKRLTDHHQHRRYVQDIFLLIK